MALIDNIVQVNITATQGTPSLPSVDTPAFIGFHTKWTDLIRTYFAATDMIADGFTVNDPLYKMAVAHCAQNPRTARFKIIRGTTSVQQVVHFKVTNASAGITSGLILKDAGGVDRAIQNVNTGSQTPAQIATALAATSVPGATLAVNGGDNTQVDITITASGAIWYPRTIVGGTYTDTTLTATPSTDLANAALVDADFYGVAGTWMSPANITDIATWVTSNGRITSYTTPDTNNLTLSSGVFSTLKAAASNRVTGLFSGTPETYAGVALMGNRFTDSPGADTWAFVTLQLVPVDALTPAQISAATSLNGAVSNNGNVYVSVANVNCTLTGMAASGLYIDLQRGIDALSRDMQVAVFTVLKAASDAGKKVPFSRKGISMIRSAVAATLQRYVVSGFLSDDDGFQFQISMPDITQTTSTDRGKRILRNVNWTAYATNAVQTVLINGSISF